MRYLPLVVVVILVTTTVGAGVVPPSSEAGEGQVGAVDVEPSYAVQATDDGNANMTNVLSIPPSEIERSDIRRQHANLGPAAGFDTSGTTDELISRTLERELSTVDGAERETRITEELTRIESELGQLEDRERSATREFSAGEISPREFVTELAAIHLNANRLRDRTELLENQATTFDSNTALNDRFKTIEYDLRMLEGPLRAHAVEILRAERPSNRILIETGDESISLTAIDGDQYIREVHRKGLRGEKSGTASEAVEIVQQQYPIIWDQRTSWTSDGPGSVMMVTVNIDRGQLRTFIDGSTNRTFIEHQQLPLDLITTTEPATKEQDGLNVTTEQTYAGGPLRLTVTDVSTGDPVAATVTVGRAGEESQRVGTTDREGQLWMISPRNRFTITILGDDTSAAFVDVMPSAPETVITAE